MSILESLGDVLPVTATGGTASRLLADKLGDGISVLDVCDPTADDVSADLQANVLDQGLVAFIPDGVMLKLQAPLIWKRGGGFISSNAGDIYPTTAQGGISSKSSGFVWNGTAFAGAMLRLSKLGIGLDYVAEGATAFDSTLIAPRLDGITVDGANLADMGVYGYRLMNPLIRRNVFTRCVGHGAYITHSYSGIIAENTAFRNMGCGISIGRGNLDYTMPTGSACNALRIFGNWGYANGYDGTFDEDTNPSWGYGIGIMYHRGNMVWGNTAENNDGPNFWLRPTSAGTIIRDCYSELANSLLTDGAGTDAVTEGRASRKYAVWLHSDNNGAHGNGIDGAYIAAEYVRLTGTEPTDARYGGGFLLANISGGLGTVSDWGSFRLVNCNEEMETTHLSQAPDIEAGTINGNPVVADFTPQAHSKFDASGGSIPSQTSYNCTVAYVSTGIYDVSITEAMANADYMVALDLTTANRIARAHQKTTSAFRVTVTTADGTTAADTAMQFAVFGKRALS